MMFNWSIDHHESLTISGFLMEFQKNAVITIGDNRYNVYYGTGLKKNIKIYYEYQPVFHGKIDLISMFGPFRRIFS